MNCDLPKAELLDHHRKEEYCLSRKAYRNGRKKTAVKVFTVNAESKFIMVTNVHATGLANDLVKTFSKFGTVTQCNEVSNYPREPFTQVFLIKFDDIQSARIAKRKGDEMYFYGSTLHVFYAPEYETVNDTRDKLMKRRLNVVQRLRNLAKEGKRDKNSAKSNHKTCMTANFSSSQHPHNPSGTYSNMASSRTESEIKPSLPQIMVSQRLKRCHSENLAGTSCVENSSSSTADAKPLKPHRKKPKLFRLPGYVPAKNVSLDSD